MNCARAAKVLPLLVGDDLKERTKREVQAHLAACRECRALEAELMRSRAWLAAVPAPSFEEAEAEELRRAVWREIRAGGHRAGGVTRRGVGIGPWRAAGVVAALLIAFAAFLRLRPGRDASPVSTLASITPREKAVALAPPPHPEESLAREPAPSAPPFSRARRGRRARAVASDVVKIEFQTANPDVRIIWLVKKSAEPPSAAGRNQEVS